jgi:lipid A 3-O-deacylase
MAKTAVWVAVVVLAAASAANAQPIPVDKTPDPDELRNIFTFQVDNDFFNIFGKSDRDYTNGVRFGWLSPALMDLPDGIARLTTLPTFFGEDPASSVTRRFGVSFGQNLYTPENLATSQPIFNDRPYAAWLYLGFALQSNYKRVDPKTGKDEPVRLDTWQLDFGVVGPAAGGEFVQNNFHTLIGNPHAMGWANQIHNEPTVGLTFERRWRALRGVLLEDPKFEYDIVPRIGATVGNVVTYASTGATLRIGKDLRSARPCPAPKGSSARAGAGTSSPD